MKRENSNLEVQTTLDARPGQLPALERWLQLNGESFRRWPGLTNIEWARVPGRESISLRLAYASFPALERNYERSRRLAAHPRVGGDNNTRACVW